MKRSQHSVNLQKSCPELATFKHGSEVKLSGFKTQLCYLTPGKVLNLSVHQFSHLLDGAVATY